MLKIIRFIIGCVALYACLVVGTLAGPKEICLTFDDLPVVRVNDYTERTMITDQILGALEEFNAPAAGFVIGDNIGDSKDLLRQWLEAGHTLGNHTWSHPDLNSIPAKFFIDDIDHGDLALEDLLKEYKQKGRFFRYPFLHYGNEADVRSEVEKHLKDKNYRIAHVSIDPEDYVYNLQFEKLHDAADSIEFVALGDEYLDHVMARVDEAEKLAQEIMGRPIKHILLLHANRLNGYFLPDLLAALQEEGYKFITLEKALTDQVYDMVDNYLGSNGLSILERLAKSNPDLLPAREK